MSDKYDKYKPDRPVFCGNFEYEVNENKLLDLFEKYGPVDRLDMKTGFAFVYYKDKRDGDDAVKALEGREFGTYKRRPLKVEWAKQKESERKRDTQPSTTLFVVNFDAHKTRERDIERHFEDFGRLVRVEIKKNYAFVQFKDVETATKAYQGTNNTRLMGKQITVEYVQNSDPWGGVKTGDRDQDRDRGRGGGDRGRERDRSRDHDRERDRDRDRPRDRSRSRDRAPPPRRRSPSPNALPRSPPPRSPPPPARTRDRSPPPRTVGPVGDDRSPSYDRSPSR